LVKSSPDLEVEREAVEGMAMLAFERGDNEEAERSGSGRWARGGDPAATARCGLGLAMRRLRAGDHVRAGDLLEQALVRAGRPATGSCRVAC